MFVQDVENAAPGDQLARGISRDSGADAVLGVQRRRGSCAIWHDRAGGECKAAGCRGLLAAVAVGSSSPLISQ